MLAFHVQHNGKKICAAGAGKHGVLSAMITWVGRASSKRGPKEELKLDLSGLDSTTGEHHRWLDRSLRLGDEVRIKILPAKRVDPPAVRKQPDAADILRSQKKYVQKMAKGFGWKIVK